MERSTVVAGLLAGIAGVIGSFAVAGGTRAFVGARIAASLTTLTPATIVTASIESLGHVAQLVVFGSAIVIAVVTFGAAAAIALRFGDRLWPRWGPVGLTVLLGWDIAVGLTGSITPGLVPAVAMGAVVWLIDRPTPRARAVSGRRPFLKAVGGVVGFSAVAAVIGADRRNAIAGVEPVPDRPTVEARLRTATERSLRVPGLEGLVSEEFYEVDINSINPSIRADAWTLSVTGAVGRELEVDYDQLRSMAHDHRFATLRCIGDSLNGRQMDTALWTGVPAADLLERAEPNGACGCVMLRAADGYFEEFPIAALRSGLFAFGMNGEPLPRRHGFPLRALVPGHWGEVNVKWLTEIEVLEREEEGFWERRGWHGTGPVGTVAKLHAVNRRGGVVQVGGHAYAGIRGIDRVEVSVDGGRNWASAELSAPLPGEDVWRQWAYVFEPTRQKHEVVVRAVDGEGALQPDTRSSPFPHGPTGWVSKTIDTPG